MPPTSTPAQDTTHTVTQPGSRTHRPVYQVAFQRTRQPRRDNRRFSKLSKNLRIADLLLISGCLAWVAMISTGFLIFVTLFAKAAGTILAFALAHPP